MTSIALFAMLSAPANAVVPLPVTPNCAKDAIDQCPNELGLNDWDYVSWIPPGAELSIRPSERALGSGLGADQAWQLNTGRWDVTIAIVDTGLEWDNRNLANKVLLNTAELPLPQLADGTTSTSYDVDGNGVVNTRDWAEDPRVHMDAGQPDADGLLEPSDLIYTFSDGVDGDKNGFIDDIAGWDFFQDDNDVWPHVRDTYSSHGTGVMEDAGAEGGDGGSIGVCPNCSILPLRSGDGIISDGDRVGLAIAYATDRGASVVGMALGSLSHSTLTDEAITYADESGVVLVSVTGDENAYHHNYPSVKSPILYVHSVRSNTQSDDVYSYMSFLGCNNFGPRVDLVAGTDACATGSSSRISGAAGLIISAAKDHGTPLLPDQVRALLRTTVDDVAFSDADQDELNTYPAKVGWDAFYGYGRVDVGTAVRAVYADAIPPVARLQGPEWFAWPEGTILVDGLASSAVGVASWKLEVGTGMEPETWANVGGGSGPVDGELGRIDTAAYGDFTFEDPIGNGVVDRAYRAHDPLVTVRLTVTDTDGRSTEDRRSVWVKTDPDRFVGFPLQPGGSIEPAPSLADLDGDGDYEIVLATGAGQVHIYQADGSELAGFPVETDPIPELVGGYAQSKAYTSGAVRADQPAAILSTPAIGDVDGDGSPELVAGDLRGRLYVWKADGTRMAGFPVSIEGHDNAEFTANHAWDRGILSAPALADIDGDGTLEMIVGGMDQRLYIWKADGSLMPGYPITLCQPEACGTSGRRIISSPAIGDVDDDGDLDIVIGTNEVPQGAAGLLYIVDATKAEVWPGWPIERDGLINQQVLPVIGEGHPSSAALADLDGDGTLEIFANPMLGTFGPIDLNGDELYDLPYYRDGFGAGNNLSDENSFVPMVTNPAFGDLDMDGVPDLVVAGAGVFYLLSLPSTTVADYQHALGGWSGASGASLPGFPRALEDVSFLDAPAIADIDGDAANEAIYGTAGYMIHAWNAEGEEAPGWPKFTGGWILGSPAVGDIDGDGLLDVVATTREGWLFAWHTDGRADQDVQWANMRHDPQNTGNWHTPLAHQAGPPDEPEKGCCHKKHAETEGAALLLALAPWLLRKRRRA